MKIVFKPSFIKKLGNQIEYIAQHNPSVARKFKERPRPQGEVSNFISQFRDLIYKRHIIVFRINSNQLEVFGLVYYQKTT